MNGIRVQDVESVRFSAPDLAQMRSFLLDFGLVDAEPSNDGVLRMRGSGTAPFIHETVEGAPGFVSVTLRATGVDDLEVLARAEGSYLEPAPGPGGGAQVTLTDPDGFVVNVIAEKARVTALSGRPPAIWNNQAQQARKANPKRLTNGPAQVVRLGHLVLAVSSAQVTWEWWQSRFGLIMSDEVRAPNGDLAAAFIRCNRGAELTDHHSLNFAAIPGKPPAFHHAAFEVLDLDDLMVGHEHLKLKQHTHDWGVGRHILGSQVFDYWKDPWGNRVEHWTDGDLFAADAPTGVADLATMLGHQWGPDTPPNFV